MRFSTEGDPLDQAADVVEQLGSFVAHCRGVSRPAGTFMLNVTPRTIEAWKASIANILASFPECVVSDDQESCLLEVQTWQTVIEQRDFAGLEHLFLELDRRVLEASAARIHPLRQVTERALFESSGV